MKAAIRSKYGQPEVLSIREVDKPVPRDTEVLIKVLATTVNRTDCAILTGKPFIMHLFYGFFNPKHPTTGTDFAGIIEATGSKVTRFRTGDRVWGFKERGNGTHRQYITIAWNEPLLTIPENISFQQAAASPEGAYYAYGMIRKTPLKQGDHVLVYGATGAIGSALVQLLKYFGATITAVCNTKNIELVRSLGASRVIDHTKEDFTRDDQQYHFVFDAVGKSTFKTCKPLLLPGGSYLSTDLGPGNQNIYLPLTTRFSKRKVKFPMPADIRGSLELIRELLVSGQFRPVIDREYPLEKIADAFNYVLSGQKTGNVVLKLED